MADRFKPMKHTARHKIEDIKCILNSAYGSFHAKSTHFRTKKQSKTPIWFKLIFLIVFDLK